MNSKEEIDIRMAEACGRCPELLKVVIDFSAEAIVLARKRPRSMMLVFCVSMLERLHSACEGISVLLDQYIFNHRKFDYSIGIVIRSTLLDYMIMLNVMEICHRQEQNSAAMLKELEEFCLAMLSDSAIHSLKYFRNNIEQIPRDRLKGMYSRQVELHDYCFEPYAHDGTEPVLKTKKIYSQAELVKRLKRSTQFAPLARKEDWYMYYSKYDHFGQMYHGVSKQPLPHEMINMDMAIRELPRSLTMMVGLMHLVCPEDEDIKGKLLEVKKYAQKIREMEDKESEDFYAKQQKKKIK